MMRCPSGEGLKYVTTRRESTMLRACGMSERTASAPRASVAIW